MKIPVAIAIALITMFGGWYVWEKGLQKAVHDLIVVQVQAADLEIDLQRIQLELKLFRAIEERRSLTPDELARRDYLLKVREIYLAEQAKRVI